MMYKCSGFYRQRSKNDPAVKLMGINSKTIQLGFLKKIR